MAKITPDYILEDPTSTTQDGISSKYPRLAEILRLKNLNLDELSLPDLDRAISQRLDWNRSNGILDNEDVFADIAERISQGIDPWTGASFVIPNSARIISTSIFDRTITPDYQPQKPGKDYSKYTSLGFLLLNSYLSGGTSGLLQVLLSIPPKDNTPTY